MRHPQLGALRHRMSLEAPVRIAGEGGGASVTWQPVATVWAQVVPISGREVFQADGIVGLAMHEVRLRYRADVTPEMRFTMGGRVFDIRAVRDIEGRRRWLSCLCEEQSP